MKAATRPPLRSTHSHSHRQKTPSSTGGTPLAQAMRAPSSAAPTMSTSFSPLRTPGGKEQARPSSPNYFGLPIEPTSDAKDPAIGLNDNRSPSSPSRRSFIEQTPRHVPIESNSDFDAFRRQTEANKSFSLGHGNLSHFASAPLFPVHPSKNGNTTSNDGSTGIMTMSSMDSADQDSWPSFHSNITPTLQRNPPPFFGVQSQTSPKTTQSPRSLPFVQQDIISQLGDRRPWLSLPGDVPSQPTSYLRQQDDTVRAETLPLVLVNEPAFISPPDLRDFLETNAPSQYLLLDLRVAPQYAQSRIRNALNLCIPTTLLKRPSFNLKKLIDTFEIPEERSKFSRWNEYKYIVVYDSHSTERKDAVAPVNTIKKFTNEGWNGKAYILKGGFRALSTIQSEVIDHEPKHNIQASKNLSLGSVISDVAHVAGGCEIPAAKSVANPFFSNIRQNMDLVGGVGQIDVKRPDDADHLADDFLPSWLRKAVDSEDHGKMVSEKFLHIEQVELSRMQNALSSRVSYGAPDTRPGNDVQIAGFEKGGKNRYNNIWPFEHARVKLQGIPDGACDYVNASHIKPLWSNKRYIASQGPLPATFEDFWSVIWDQEVRVIVMLTAESEGGQVKCHPYWTVREYGQFKINSLSERKVSLESSTHYRPPVRQESSGRRRANTAIESSTPDIDSGDKPDVIIRTITLTRLTQPLAPAREITQLYYSSWPDFGTPAKPSHLLGLIKLSNSVQYGALSPAIASRLNLDEPAPDQGLPPILVHCSAGCGRTGTFCTVDSVIDILKRQRKEHQRGVTPMDVSTTEVADYLTTKQLSDDVERDWIFNPNIDLIERTVADLRTQRISMVQSLRQYVLCYETVLGWIGQQYQARKRDRSGSESWGVR